jgi:6-phosphogluconolactonase
VSRRLEVVPDPAQACSELLLEAARAGGHIVLAGGSTPKAAYELAAASADAWDGATLWFGDERCVPPEDERSNYRMVRESLLHRLGAEHAPKVHRIEGELGPAAAADAYERALEAAGPPAFDLVLLGIGADGHTASLFPDQTTLSEQERLVIGVQKAGLEPFVPRVSLTMRGLALGKLIVFLASGESKVDAVSAAFGPTAKPDPHIPASLLPPLAGEVVVLLDAAAAAKVTSMDRA